METQQTFWQRNSVMIKAMVVGFLVLVLLIPSAFIMSLVNERSQRQEEVVQEVSSKWALAQTFTGPFITIPYTVTQLDEKGKQFGIKKVAYFLPEQLLVNGKLIPEIRSRSIFKVALYKTDLNISGSFSPINVKSLGIDPATVNWKDVRICFGLSDNRGIAEQVMLNWKGMNTELEPGLPENFISTTGINALIANTDALQTEAHPFSMNLKLNGSEQLYFTPLGKQTTVSMNSSWKDPAFEGKYLPKHKVVNDSGFTAKWEVSHFQREIPQSFTDTKPAVHEAGFGVRLLQANDSYGKTMRSVKYALLFIALTFCIYFFIELIKKRHVHPLQYILVGVALCIFYTLLLSISEYLGFDFAYLIASFATVLLIGLYTKSLFHEWSIAGAFFLFLSMLYGFIYILIRLQDGALLFGSIGLFILLAIVMYYSKKIDWSGTSSKQKAAVA
jgi:inner membrane protein